MQMTQEQLNCLPSWTACEVCRKPFSSKWNKNRHMTQVHQVRATSACSSASEPQFPLRCTVNGVVEELMNGNFTKPETELLATISELAPDLTTREAEVLLSATAATARWVAGTALSLGTLWRQGKTGTAAERDLERRLAYLHVGPSRPLAVPSQPAVHTSPPASVMSAGDRTNQWLEGLGSVQEQPLRGDGGIEMMEVAAAIAPSPHSSQAPPTTRPTELPPVEPAGAVSVSGASLNPASGRPKDHSGQNHGASVEKDRPRKKTPSPRRRATDRHHERRSPGCYRRRSPSRSDGARRRGSDGHSRCRNYRR